MIVGAIELTEAERELLEPAGLKASSRIEHIDARRRGDAACELTLSLLDRRAIPECRLLYFWDPQYNIGGGGRSVKDTFEKNGTRGEDIFRHASFAPYLKYFLFGAELPDVVINEFLDEVLNCGTVTSGDIVPLCKHAKRQAQALGLSSRKASEEFYKLSLDCELGAAYARMIRDAVRR